MNIFDSIFPAEVVNKLMLYNSHPVADVFNNEFRGNIIYCDDGDISFYDEWIDMKELLYIADRKRRRDKAFKIQMSIRTSLRGPYRETYDEWCDRWVTEEETYEQYKERIYYSKRINNVLRS